MLLDKNKQQKNTFILLKGANNSNKTCSRLKHILQQKTNKQTKKLKVMSGSPEKQKQWREELPSIRHQS